MTASRHIECLMPFIFFESDKNWWPERQFSHLMGTHQFTSRSMRAHSFPHPGQAGTWDLFLQMWAVAVSFAGILLSSRSPGGDEVPARVLQLHSADEARLWLSFLAAQPQQQLPTALHLQTFHRRHSLKPPPPLVTPRNPRPKNCALSNMGEKTPLAIIISGNHAKLAI